MDAQLDQRIRELDVDALLDTESQAAIRSLIAEGHALLPALADWGRRARPFLEQELPEDVYEDGALNEAVMDATGLGALNDIVFLIRLVVGDPDATPSDAVANRLLAQYAELVGSHQ